MKNAPLFTGLAPGVSVPAAAPGARPGLPLTLPQVAVAVGCSVPTLLARRHELPPRLAVVGKFQKWTTDDLPAIRRALAGKRTWHVSPEDREEIASLAACGLRMAEICRALNLSLASVRYWYRKAGF